VIPVFIIHHTQWKFFGEESYLLSSPKNDMEMASVDFCDMEKASVDLNKTFKKVPTVWSAVRVV